MKELSNIKKKIEAMNLRIAKCEAELAKAVAAKLNITKQATEFLASFGIKHDCTDGGTKRIYHIKNVGHAIADVMRPGRNYRVKEIVALVRERFPDKGYSEAYINLGLYYHKDTECGFVCMSRGVYCLLSK